MLYWLLYEQLYPAIGPFRVFRFFTARTMFASLTSLFLCVLLGPWLIRKLREFQIGQHIREDGPATRTSGREDGPATRTSGREDGPPVRTCAPHAL